MGPRKRLKTDTPETPPFEIPLPNTPEASHPLESPNAVEIGAPNTAEPEKADSISVRIWRPPPVVHMLTVMEPRWTRSWYGGTWPQVAKAAPVTQVARESISAASSAASGLVSSARSRRTPSGPMRSPSLYGSRGMGSSSRSLPVAATTTKVNITSNATLRSKASDEHGQPPECERTDITASIDHSSGERQDVKDGEELITTELKKQDATPEAHTCPPRTQLVELGPERPLNGSSSWLGWLSRNTASNREDGSTQTPEPAQDSSQLSSNKSPNEPSAQESHEPVTQESESNQLNTDTLPSRRSATAPARPNPWFNLWNSAAAPRSNDIGEDDPVTALESPRLPTSMPVPKVERDQDQNKATAEGSTAEAQTLSTSSKAVARTPGWAFWSRDNAKQEDRTRSFRAGTGDLAVADTPSQKSPKSATVAKATSLGKRGRPQSLEATVGAATSQEPRQAENPKPVSANSNTKLTELVASKQLQSVLPNLVLPLFEKTYGPQQSPTLLQQLGKLLRYGELPKTPQVHIIRDPPRIKRALAIGVHGYFPAPLIRTVLGQPTGTSIRFATSAASAISEWTTKHGYSCEIEKIALEGEGKILERVELLWRLLLNWLDVIRKADFILVACHSQGVPVTIMLVGRLIALGCVESARIGICAMAGINLGPFADYKSRWIGGSAGELFDFARPESTVSRDYTAALETVLRYGVRVVYIGSIDDQLVSLEVC